MAENKTKPTDDSVQGYLQAIEDDGRRADCEALIAAFRAATKQEPVMWGTSIIGFGSYSYRYASGRTGESCLVGLSSRKGDISLYGLQSAPDGAGLLGRLGKHRAGKGCLYVKRVADIDLDVLEELARESAAETVRQHS